MDDLIRRQDAIDAIRAFYDEYIVYDNGKSIEDLISELPSAQPERKRGKWVLHPEVRNIYGGIYIECSECHTKYVVQYVEDEKYCRNCGAEMERGEANEMPNMRKSL
jgi:PHP family Zn ribbon phosphoesterase